MKFFVLFVLFWGVLFGTALSLIAGEDGQEIPVDQPFGKFEENESKEELKKGESTTHLFGTVAIDFFLDKSIESSLYEIFFFVPPVNHSPDRSRAPPVFSVNPRPLAIAILQCHDASIYHLCICHC
ncbi:hypothetical protein [uncultured Gimesia sp.]|uniref:hypothetical protein n=1 Tax=uncultured Gimesia sp. TaxID=1678688 RepID=UPI00261CAF3D|nr:hypothetical protein [uncultured Gimesia sp.]